MFMFKKIVAPLFFPLSICLAILLLGLFFLWFTRRQKTGKIVISTGVVLLTIISYDVFSNMLLRPLEYKYSPITDTSALQSIKWVVVLGGGHYTDPILPVTDQLSAASLVRLAEGIRIHKKIFNSKLLLSGGSAYGSDSEASVMAEMATELGIDDNDIVLESKSKDTKDQARFIYDIIGNSRFILVTSASHMARSVALFQAIDMKPIPAPIGYLVKKTLTISPANFFPSTNGIDKMERVVYEYLGIVWAMLRRQLSS